MEENQTGMYENHARMDQTPAAFADAVLGAVRAQLEIYPRSSLRDIYKSFFQDEFGPGHLLLDPGRARSAFDEELAGMRSRDRRSIEPCGRGRHYCRVPLDMILEGLIDADRYFSLFLESASEFRLPDFGTWKSEWERIEKALTPLGGRIRGFHRDSEAIAGAFEAGKYVMHHSDQYQKSYDPHYRIISVRHVGRTLPGGLSAD